MATIKSIPMSDTTTGRRVDDLATDIFETLLARLKEADFMSLAVDESTDNSDTAQLCLFVRFFDGDGFKEDILNLIPLEGHTTGEIIFQNIVAVFPTRNINTEYCGSLSCPLDSCCGIYIM